jgi:hypothetical protein
VVEQDAVTLLDIVTKEVPGLVVADTVPLGHAITLKV